MLLFSDGKGKSPITMKPSDTLEPISATLTFGKPYNLWLGSLMPENHVFHPQSESLPPELITPNLSVHFREYSRMREETY